MSELIGGVPDTPVVVKKDVFAPKAFAAKATSTFKFVAFDTPVMLLLNYLRTISK